MNDAVPVNGAVPASHAGLTEKSIALHTTHRQEMALWLAVEVLMTSAAAVADEVLADRLIALQDRLEAQLRAAAAA